jgi:AAA15 family ATPase/GTPase
MILSFTLENWMSFRDTVSFSMIASRERQHGKRVSKVGKYKARILPIAAIYGGNASGKTNFFKALSFAKNLVVKGTQPDSLIPIEPFLLSQSGVERPCRFVFELLIEEKIYEYSFAVTRKAVLEEKMVLITSNSEKVLYNRQGDNPAFDASFHQDQFLHFAFKGTRDNQLFLTNSVSQKVGTFRPVYNWFKDSLALVAPDSRFEPFEQFLNEDHPLYDMLNKMLYQLDTGISQLSGEVIPLDNISLPEGLKNQLQEIVKEGITLRIWAEPSKERFAITRKNDELIAKKLVTYHHKENGMMAKFDMRNESDGSIRVIDLLPVFLKLSDTNSNKVFIVDEVDRSLHTLLTRQLIEFYLSHCSNGTRTQLLFTTHDVLLMDQQIFRRDEMWVTERDLYGKSNLFSFSEYKDIRYDKDIRKSYLQGRLGGIPKIVLGGSLKDSSIAQECV